MSPGPEIIVGARRDPIFGAVVMVGIGGRLVEALNRQALRLSPLSEGSAMEMVEELELALTKPEMSSLSRILLGLDRLLGDHEEVYELDLNPVIITPHGLIAVDLRVRTGTSAKRLPDSAKTSDVEIAAGTAISKMMSLNRDGFIGDPIR